jgi:hypothetical protein
LLRPEAVQHAVAQAARHEVGLVAVHREERRQQLEIAIMRGQDQDAPTLRVRLAQKRLALDLNQPIEPARRDHPREPQELHHSLPELPIHAPDDGTPLRRREGVAQRAFDLAQRDAGPRIDGGVRQIAHAAPDPEGPPQGHRRHAGLDEPQHRPDDALPDRQPGDRSRRVQRWSVLLRDL